MPEWVTTDNVALALSVAGNCAFIKAVHIMWRALERANERDRAHTKEANERDRAYMARLDESAMAHEASQRAQRALREKVREGFEKADQRMDEILRWVSSGRPQS